jgi:hypothetical protein
MEHRGSTDEQVEPDARPREHAPVRPVVRRTEIGAEGEENAIVWANVRPHAEQHRRGQANVAG